MAQFLFIQTPFFIQLFFSLSIIKPLPLPHPHTMSFKAPSITIALSSVFKRSANKHIQTASFSTSLRLNNEKPKIRRLPSFAQIQAVQLDQYIEEISKL